MTYLPDTSNLDDWFPRNGFEGEMARLGVVVGGSFTSLRNRLTGRVVTRNRLAAFSRSGQLLGSFARGANNTVRSLESDGSRVFVGGAFTRIAGRARRRCHLARWDR